MLEKLIDENVLSALLLMSKNKKEGIKYCELMKQRIMPGAEELVKKGYAKNIVHKKNGAELSSYYKLNGKGIKYFKEILKFAYKKFK